MRAVFDTNAVIYLQKGLLRQPLLPGEYFISVITELELLTFHSLDATQKTWLDTFLSDIGIIELNALVKENTVRLRREHRLRLPDAIIAASALSHDATLLTNDQRLLNVQGLRSQAVELTHVFGGF
ncbi:MAG: PIN domain-containing protein [Rhodoferax sp.]|nr:PIN domain-containing protein [Rhodoferax sp.]